MEDVELEKYKLRIEGKLGELIPEGEPASLYEGARYSVLGAGKRIRPLLTLCTAEMLQQGASEVALVPACALEMVHTYSLIHDDLPCMDDDDFRRGRPTLHRVYSEGHAVLVGDYLLTYAFEVISTAPHLASEQKVTLMQKLALAAGAEGMIGGQIMDIENSNQIEQMHARKTAALFCAAVEFGGVITTQNPLTMSLLMKFGIQFGQLFQMVDDLLDGDHPLGENKAEKDARILYEAALTTLNRLPGDTASLKKLTGLVLLHAYEPIPNR
jgi:geranylgeranyl diphosphate synthase, type II